MISLQEKVISKDGTVIAYWRTGEGRPLVLVHGTTADHTRWDLMRPLLEPHATLIAMDRRGRGASGDADGYHLAREYEDVAAVVDALAAETGGPVDLFGHSYGAVCSIGAARLTQNVRKLVLYEPVVHPEATPAGFLERAESLLAEGRRDELVATFFRDVVRIPADEVERMREQPAWRMRVDAAHTLVREERTEAAQVFDVRQCRDVRVPALMLVGSESPRVIRESTDAIANALPDVRVHELDGQQHMALTTAPKLVADAVVQYLSEGDPEPSR